MTSARVVAHGAPFNTPLGAALLKNGDLVVANADIGIQAPSAATNLLIEVSPVVPGGFVGRPLQLATDSLRHHSSTLATYLPGGLTGPPAPWGAKKASRSAVRR